MDLVVSYDKATDKFNAWDLAKAQITPEYVEKFKVKAEIAYDRDGAKMEATGKGFTLSLVFDENECKVAIKLSMFLKPLKGKVLEAVENKLKKTI
ncbi:polyhydroxyalkanoic acid system family protein [Halobacteriovorax sp. GB3]|uniref:polyhydroxyalkanoic acid system family protein n=1 Tax=Halobacteriovorax sp. GB3 TaxID=2719615 RepID=UPI0023604027|nr:polyhydroxyalkanoic acid system family protein [Halobacteriovorax sp. GB3]MDD0853120.1 polyhydroxyalkanoic acid system family protein [Halobacteriovorax sp. GB3]